MSDKVIIRHPQPKFNPRLHIGIGPGLSLPLPLTAESTADKSVNV